MMYRLARCSRKAVRARFRATGIGRPRSAYVARMERRTVVITGASSGIGKAAALHLAALGWTVYAGVRKQEDADALEREAAGDLVPVFLDVTNDTQILGSSGRIAQDVGERGLD